MFSVTPYTFQPLFNRFQVLWRYVQVVSDCLTYTLFILCCKCAQVMPVSMTSSCAEIIDATSSKDLEIPKVNYTKSSGELETEHVTVDLDYNEEIKGKMKPKCLTTGAPINELKTDGNLTIENISIDSIKELGKNWRNHQDIPTIHAKKKMDGWFVKFSRMSRRSIIRRLVDCPEKYYQRQITTNVLLSVSLNFHTQ